MEGMDLGEQKCNKPQRYLYLSAILPSNLEIRLTMSEHVREYRAVLISMYASGVRYEIRDLDVQHWLLTPTKWLQDHLGKMMPLGPWTQIVLLVLLSLPVECLVEIVVATC